MKVRVAPESAKDDSQGPDKPEEHEDEHEAGHEDSTSPLRSLLLVGSRDHNHVLKLYRPLVFFFREEQRRVCLVRHASRADDQVGAKVSLYLVGDALLKFGPLMQILLQVALRPRDALRDVVRHAQTRSHLRLFKAALKNRRQLGAHRHSAGGPYVVADRSGLAFACRLTAVR